MNIIWLWNGKIPEDKRTLIFEEKSGLKEQLTFTKLL